MVEQTSAAAHNLAGEVAKLTDQAGHFIVDAGARHAGRRPTGRVGAHREAVAVDQPDHAFA